jgi:hypothetical protein
MGSVPCLHPVVVYLFLSNITLIYPSINSYNPKYYYRIRFYTSFYSKSLRYITLDFSMV